MPSYFGLAYFVISYVTCIDPKKLILRTLRMIFHFTISQLKTVFRSQDMAQKLS